MDVDNSPRAAHIADEIGGEKVDQMFCGLRLAAGAKEGRIAENEPRGNFARLEQGLRPVEVLRHEVVKRGPLNQSALKLLPLRAGYDNRNEVYRPWLPASGIRKQVVGNPVFANETAQPLLAPELLLRRKGANAIGEGLPMLSDLSIRVDGFVEPASGRRVAGKKPFRRGKVLHGAAHGPH